MVGNMCAAGVGVLTARRNAPRIRKGKEKVAVADSGSLRFPESTVRTRRLPPRQRAYTKVKVTPQPSVQGNLTLVCPVTRSGE